LALLQNEVRRRGTPTKFSIFVSGSTLTDNVVCPGSCHDCVRSFVSEIKIDPMPQKAVEALKEYAHCRVYAPGLYDETLLPPFADGGCYLACYPYALWEEKLDLFAAAVSIPNSVLLLDSSDFSRYKKVEGIPVVGGYHLRHCLRGSLPVDLLATYQSFDLIGMPCHPIAIENQLASITFDPFTGDLGHLVVPNNSYADTFTFPEDLVVRASTDVVSHASSTFSDTSVGDIRSFDRLSGYLTTQLRIDDLANPTPVFPMTGILPSPLNHSEMPAPGHFQPPDWEIASSLTVSGFYDDPFDILASVRCNVCPGMCSAGDILDQISTGHVDFYPSKQTVRLLDKLFPDTFKTSFDLLDIQPRFDQTVGIKFYESFPAVSPERVVFYLDKDDEFVLRGYYRFKHVLPSSSIEALGQYDYVDVILVNHTSYQRFSRDNFAIFLMGHVKRLTFHYPLPCSALDALCLKNDIVNRTLSLTMVDQVD